MACTPIDDRTFLSSVLTHLDCQAKSIGDGGFHALSQPGSTGQALLAAVLTIFVAVTGYRLLFGEHFGAREVIMLGIKLGAALVIATNWPAVKIVFYDVVMHGPSQLVQQIGEATAIPGLEGDLSVQLQNVDWQLDELDQLGSGAISRDTAGETAVGAARRVDMQRDLSWLGLARLVFLTSTISSFALVRFAGGVLLALTPLFALLLLFDATRGLFLGWLRGLVASTLGGVTVTIVLGVELALLEPWLANVVELRRANFPTPSAPVEALVVTLVFAIALIGLLYLGARVSGALTDRSFILVRASDRSAYLDHIVPSKRSPMHASPFDREGLAERSRALRIADAVSRAAEISVVGGNVSTVSDRTGNNEPGRRDYTPLGQRFGSRTRNRVSTSMARRNGK